MSLAEETSTAAAAAPAPADPRLAGDPSLIGVPTFVVGSIALGLSLVGYVPAAAVGAPIAILLFATGVGQVISAVWAAGIGQSLVAGIFGIFSGFWLSYSALVMGLVNGWYGITEADAVAVQGLFLLSWFILVVVLFLGTLRMPMAFSVLFFLVAVALLLVYLGTVGGAANLAMLGGYVVLLFALVGVYLFLNAASAATGGKGLPLGRPVIRG